MDARATIAGFARQEMGVDADIYVWLGVRGVRRGHPLRTPEWTVVAGKHSADYTIFRIVGRFGKSPLLRTGCKGDLPNRPTVIEYIMFTCSAVQLAEIATAK